MDGWIDGWANRQRKGEGEREKRRKMGEYVA